MIKKIVILILVVYQLSVQAQTKTQYLKENRLDLNQAITFPQTDFKIVGFGALHGSSKTDEAEVKLLKSLLKNNDLRHYIMETDFSIGYYFNVFLESRDTLLLKDLVSHYGIRVPQEKTIETYKKWLDLFNLNQKLPEHKKLKVYGTDPIVSYKYTFKHLIELTDAILNVELLHDLRVQVDLDTTDFSPYYESFSKSMLRKFVSEVKSNDDWKQIPALSHLIKNIEISFEQYNREKIIFDNYVSLSEQFDFRGRKQFIKYGFFHLEKEREYQNYPSFFTQLIENKIYSSNEVITVIGYLTKSEVLWELIFDENGNYVGYTTKAGYGIIDYWKEYFRGIRKLKKAKLSDLSLFRLNKLNSPYHANTPDLIEIKMLFSPSNKAGVKGKATTSFIDYALLISHSQANQPIEAMKN